MTVWWGTELGRQLDAVTASSPGSDVESQLIPESVEPRDVVSSGREGLQPSRHGSAVTGPAGESGHGTLCAEWRIRSAESRDKLACRASVPDEGREQTTAAGEPGSTAPALSEQDNAGLMAEIGDSSITSNSGSSCSTESKLRFL